MTSISAAHHDVLPAVVRGDLDSGAFSQLLESPMLSWDIETTGLEWRTDRICTVQIHDRGSVVLVQQPDEHPEYLRRLLEAPETPKLLHHAMFDLRFMAAAWNASPTRVACTKVAAKLLQLPGREQSLAPLLARYLGVTLDKSEQVSTWGARTLSTAQLRYAAGDVVHLEALMDRLRQELELQGLWELATRCFDHLPTRVALELQGFDDVYVY
jgi:ribonuclease D